MNNDRGSLEGEEQKYWLGGASEAESLAQANERVSLKLRISLPTDHPINHG
jgi:hypothetical protein